MCFVIKDRIILIMGIIIVGIVRILVFFLGFGVELGVCVLVNIVMFKMVVIMVIVDFNIVDVIFLNLNLNLFN